MKKIYLPELKSIKIENYSLYKEEPSFTFNFLDGISAIVGGNGIGKTTFVQIIIYCLVGFKKEDFEKGKKKKPKNTEDEQTPGYDFFRVRMNSSYPDNKDACAFLELIINKNNLIVGRSLNENKVVFLSLNGEDEIEPNEEKYENLINKYTGLTSFSSFDNLVRNFLFFNEQRTNIAWSTDSQDKILRSLFFEEELFEKFKFLEEEVIKLDSAGRHLSEDRKAVSKYLKSLKDEKEKLKNKNEENRNEDTLSKLFEEKNNYEEELNELKRGIEDLLEVFRMYNDNYNNLIGEKEGISLNIGSIDDEISKMESKLFTNMYDSLPDFYLPLERTLTNDGTCLICGTKGKEIKEESVKKSKNGLCLVCSSPINIDSDVEPEFIDKINRLSLRREEFINSFNNKTNEIENAKNQIDIYSKQITSLNESLNKVQQGIVNVNALIAELNSKSEVDTFSQIVKNKQEAIQDLTKKINLKYRERDEKDKELKLLFRSFKSMVSSLNNSLSSYFNKYASTFIGLESELTVSEQVINKIPHVVYLPRIDGILRKDIWSVSESQRFFLDQAFRMAIIDYLQNNVPGFKTFFITETPEGSLDIAYEAQVAEMFRKFAESKNKIIFTSNLNSSRFLIEVFNGMSWKERKSRILNLLKKGKLTDVQKNNRNSERLKEILKQLLGECE